MIQISPQVVIYVSPEPIDFRGGIDHLQGIIKNTLEKDPFNGALFLFTNKRKTALKILNYDGQGFWLHLKRFSTGSLSWWPSSALSCLEIDHRNLFLLLFNGDLNSVRFQSDWKKII